MNIIKKSKRKILAGIMSAIMVLSILPVTSFTAMAADIPADWISVEEKRSDGIQVTNTPSMIEDGTGFIMSDGSVAICASHSVPAPSVGAGYTIDRSFGSSYVDGDIGTISTEWTFKAFYYAEKLEREGLNFGGTARRAYITEAAARRHYYDTLVWYDTAPYTKEVHDLYNAVVAAADADADGISGRLQYADGVVMYQGADGMGARLAYYRADAGASVQNILVYTSGIPLKGWANLVKSSANPDLTNGNPCYSLAGAVYGIYTDWNGTNEVGRFTTDEWGNTNTVELNAGTYYVKEISAPMGFAMDYTTYEVVVTAGQTATVYVTDIPQSDPVMIILQKQDSETNTDIPQAGARLENAEFTIKYFSGLYDTNPEDLGVQPTRQWILRTNEKGQSLLSEDFKISGDNLYYTSNGEPTLPIGTVTIQETKAPEGYLLNSQIFVQQITSNGSTDQVINTYNAPIIPEQVMKGSVELYKADAESGNALAGAVYGIYFHDGSEVGRLTTDIKGYARSELLPYGSYYLQEITAPNGYVLDTAQYPFTIGTAGQVITINATDKNQMGQIQGTKTGEVLTGSDFRLTELGMMYAPIYEVQGLPNAEYEIYAKEDIATPEGTVKYTAGQLVETVTTDANGQFTSQQLYLGTYVVKEKTAPEGYVQDTTEYEVTLSYGGQNQSVVLSPVALSDERQKVAVSIKKEMETHTVYPNPDAYQDVRFGLYVAEDILDVTGTVALEKDSLLEVITLNKDPAASEPTGSETLTGTVSMDLPIGSYYIQEIATNEAYILDETKYPIDFTYQGQESATVEIVVNDGQPVVNNLKKGQVELIKESDFPQGALDQGFTNLPLEGAVYGIYSTDGVEVGRLTTDIKGYAKSELLPYGSYYLKEIKAPFGYEVNENEYHFVISADGEVITITAKDQPKIGTITPEYTEHGGGENLRAATTGDNAMPVYITGGILLISGGILVFIFLFRKKGRNKQQS